MRIGSVNQLYTRLKGNLVNLDPIPVQRRRQSSAGQFIEFPGNLMSR